MGVLRAAFLALAVLLIVLPAPSSAQDEFLLNDDRVDRDQWVPKAALGPTGAMVVVWMDGRNGTTGFVDFDTYAITIRDPQALGTTVNRRLNDDPPGAIQGYPDVAASPAGSFFCVWEDGRAGNRDIYGAALDTLGLRITPNLRVNDDAGGADQVNARVAPIGSNRYLVVWSDGRQGQGEIFGSFRTAAGAAIGPNRKMSSDPIVGGSYQGEPAVAANAAGLTLVAWLDGREGGSVFGATFDVYGQWLDPSDQPLGSNFKINDTSTAQRNTSVAVAADATLGFVVAWIDRRNGPGDPGDVYAQRFDAARSAVGANRRVNDDPSGRDQRAVRALATPGAAYLLWEDLRGSLGLDSNVEAARVPYDGSPPGSNFRVNVSVPARQGTPAGAWDGRDAILAVWEDARNGGQRPSDIYAVSIRGDGVPRGTETQLNDDAAPNDQRRPRLGRGPGRYLAAWTDLRNLGEDLFCQSITSAGARDGPNYLLWSDDLVQRPQGGVGAVSNSGQGLVAAHIMRGSDPGDIRGFLFPVLGFPPTQSFWISDSLPSSQSTPALTATADGFTAAWLDGRDGGTRIYGQRLGLDGSRIGSNRPLLAVEPIDPVYALDLDGEPAGGYWLCYAEGVSADQRLWLVHLDGALVADQDPVAVSPQISGSRSRPGLGVGSDGRVEVVWLGTSATGYGLTFHQAFDPNGVPLGPPLSFSAPGSITAQATPSIAVAGSRSMVSWSEREDGNWNIWLQGLEGGVSPFTGVLRADQDALSADQIDPSIGFDAAGHSVLIWTDGRATSSGTDILGRVYSFASTAILEPDPPPPAPEPLPESPPRALRVRARPNPFSGSVGLAVDVPASAAGRVKIRVLDVRGGLVATLHDGPVAVGRGILRWNPVDRRAREMASGVYWIVIEGGGERDALRVVLLR